MHIVYVIFPSSDKQMIWINTPPVIAVMTYIHAARNVAEVKLVAHAMSTGRASLATTKTDPSITSFWVNGPDPFPASVRGGDKHLVPEPMRERN